MIRLFVPATSPGLKGRPPKKVSELIFGWGFPYISVAPSDFHHKPVGSWLMDLVLCMVAGLVSDVLA